MDRLTKSIAVLVLGMSITGCKTLRGRTMQHHWDDQQLADVLIQTGTTTTDHQRVSIPTADRDIQVKVLVPGDTNYIELNKYEFKVSSTTNFVTLGNQVQIQGQILILNGKPVAPAGSQYEIKSTALSVHSELY